MAPLAQPNSKRQSVRIFCEDFGVQLPWQKIYRMMDHLHEKRIEGLPKLAIDQAQRRLPRPIHLLWFDCTSVYFESVLADELKPPGYCKDSKFSQSPVLFALMITEQGLPVSYEWLLGASFEEHSLIPLATKMRPMFDLEKVNVVADRGMINAKNFHQLEEYGIDYILGVKLNNLCQKMKAKILEFKVAPPEQKVDKAPTRMQYQGRHVLSYRAKRAHQDRKDHDKAIQKLLTRLAQSDRPTSWMSQYGYKKFVRLDSSSQGSVNEAKLEQD